MPTNQIRIGPPQVFLSVDTDDTLPSLDTLTFSVCNVAQDDILINDVNQPLSATDTYQVILGLVGMDRENGGYTISRCSPSSGNVVVTSNNKVLQVVVPNANWPSNFDLSVAVAIFLKTNAARFQLAGFAYMDETSDFVHAIAAKPLRVSPTFATATLQSTNEDTILGSREAYGVTYEEIQLTTGDFNFRRPVSTVPVSPNNGPDFTIATGRGTGITFQSLINDIKTFVKAAAGVYVKHTYNSETVEEAHLSLNTAQAVLRENRAVKVFLAPDHNGNQEVRLLVGMLTANQVELTEAWSKSATTPVTFQFDQASLDKLITNQHVEIQYLRRAS